jgi:hypothetical protein
MAEPQELWAKSLEIAAAMLGAAEGGKGADSADVFNAYLPLAEIIRPYIVSGQKPETKK